MFGLSRELRESSRLLSRTTAHSCAADSISAIRRRGETVYWLLLFVPVILLFYWRILLTRQYSLLTRAEDINQAYSWLRFWVSSIQHGTLPLWDPYAFAGHSFVGEMQPAPFYPLHLFLALFPLNRDHLLSLYLYHAWWAGAHVLGACFLFLLAREFGLRHFPAFVAGLCFSLGGFVAGAGWPHMLESAIWLPLIFLFFLRAIHALAIRDTLRCASLGGLALGLSILAGGMHVVIMQSLAVLAAGFFYGATSESKAESSPPRWLRASVAVTVVAGIGIATGAVQLFPSIEYSHHSIRFLGAHGAFPADQEIPYAYLDDSLAPQGILSFLSRYAFGGNIGRGEVINPYMGLFALLASVIGIVKSWSHLWVRYLTGLAIASILYAFGPLSLLHGVLYALIPKLWLAREAPRMLYLADFSLALLAGFGIDILFSARGKEASWTGLNRTLLGIVIACAVCLFIPAVWGKPEISPWMSLFLCLVFATYGLFRYILRGNSGRSARLLLVGLVLFDLGALDWSIFSLTDLRKPGANYMTQILSMEPAINFLKSRPGLFRIQVETDPQANIGDFYGAPATVGGGVTLPAAYTRIMYNRDLLNVGYVLKPASATDPDPIYDDGAWKIYENSSAAPRAWIVHETMPDPMGDALPPFDLSRTALVDSHFKETLQPVPNTAREPVTFAAYAADRMTLDLRAAAGGLLILSETFYPGWRATVNGVLTPIYRVDGDLRGIVVPPGASQVVLQYVPWAIYVGGILTVLAFCATLYSCLAYRSRSTASRRWTPTRR